MNIGFSLRTCPFLKAHKNFVLGKSSLGGGRSFNGRNRYRQNGQSQRKKGRTKKEANVLDWVSCYDLPSCFSSRSFSHGFLTSAGRLGPVLSTELFAFPPRGICDVSRPNGRHPASLEES